jgi:hypothetical protein
VLDFLGAVSGHDDDLVLRPVILVIGDKYQSLQAQHTGHPDIGDHEIKVIPYQGLLDQFKTACNDHVRVLGPQRIGKDQKDGWLIPSDNDPLRAVASFM